MTWWFHLANSIFLVSYAVKDILWLRLAIVAANLATLSALLAATPAPPAASFAWQGVFFTINLARLAQLIHERRPIRLGPDARRLAAKVFPRLRPRELVRLLAVGEIVEHPAGQQVIRQGEPLAHLAIVIDGTARVVLVDARVVELSHGAFIGELSYLTGRPPAADVVAASPLRIMRWPTAALREHLADYPATHTAMQLVLGSDLASKLRATPTTTVPAR